MLYLTEQDVTSLLTMQDALKWVEEAFRLWQAGQAQNRPRQRATIPGAILNLMGASIPALRVMGYKAYGAGPEGTRFHVWLYDELGRPWALLQADRLGQMRTGAASGVATRYLARENARVLGVYGTGWQAETQVEAVCAVRPIELVRVYGRDPHRREDFCRRMAERLHVRIEPVTSPREAAEGADIIVTITNSRQPVLLGEWLKPGIHINAAGSNHPKKIELDPEAVRRADLIVVDDLDQAKVEAGDLLQLNDPSIWEQVHTLGEVIAGQHPGRTSAEAITLFESQGVAVEDVMVAYHLVNMARERGLGRDIDL